MNDTLNWMGEHPILTFVILVVLTGFLVRLVRAINGEPEPCQCDCDEEDESDSDQLP